MAKYAKNTWYDKSDTQNAIPISHTNLNNMENGIEKSFEEIAYANLKNLVVQKISSSCVWTAPKAMRNMFKVFCVGGGGGGGSYTYTSKYAYAGGGGGGGGYIEISDLEIEHGTSIDIICGAGGKANYDGGQTIFGELLFANGGECGGASESSQKGGSGGSGGSGGGGGGVYNYNNSTYYCGSGGNGYYGGGGDGGFYYSGGTIINGIGGSSTKTGGNGGSCGVVTEDSGTQFMEDPFLNILFNIGFIGNIDNNTEGKKSNGGNGYCCRGGVSNDKYAVYAGGGGGGGYCGNGADSGGCGGGGGGGYCGNGGKGNNYAGGGGGGFFCNGADGNGTIDSGNAGNGGGGGGFFSDGVGTQGGDGGVLIMYIKDDTEEE